MVRLSRQPFRTFCLLTEAESYVVARGTPPPTSFDPATWREETDFVICTDGSYTSATSVDPPRAGWGLVRPGFLKWRFFMISSFSSWNSVIVFEFFLFR